MDHDKQEQGRGGSGGEGHLSTEIAGNPTSSESNMGRISSLIE